MSKSVKVVLVVLLVLVLDQALKIWVKTNMSYGQEISMLGLSWAKLHFVENNGMAFGFSLGGEYGKLALSLFRILAVIALVYYISALIKVKARLGLLISFALILAGAVGNIIDSAVYGLIFSESYHGHIAEMFPAEGGYAGFLHGRVVDMFYFPMFEGRVPNWSPLWAGEEFLFFRPVFNIADMAITFGVISILLFHRSFFSSLNQDEDVVIEETSLQNSDGENASESLPGTESPDQSAEESTEPKEDILASEESASPPAASELPDEESKK